MIETKCVVSTDKTICFISSVYERMIVTKDMKYMPEPKPETPARLEMPFFGVSPTPSFIQVPLETTKQEEEQVFVIFCKVHVKTLQEQFFKQISCG